MTLKQKIEEKGYKFYGNEDILNTSPEVKGKYTLELFTVGKYISYDELEKEYISRSLIPADMYHLLKMDNSILDEKRSSGTHWKNTEGNLCFSTFHRWDDDRNVNVRRYDDGWNGRWWFAGLRKIGTQPLETEISFDTRLQSFVSELETLITKYK